jgi:hypothetical protein
MYPQYKSHDDATLSYIEDALPHYHTFKYVLLLGRAGKMANAKPNPLRTKLLKTEIMHEETYAETGTLSETRHELDFWRD